MQYTRNGYRGVFEIKKGEVRIKKVNYRAGCLKEYIAANFGGIQKAFAESIGVKPPQITQWINKGFIVVDDVLYSPRRELK